MEFKCTHPQLPKSTETNVLHQSFSGHTTPRKSPRRAPVVPPARIEPNIEINKLWATINNLKTVNNELKDKWKTSNFQNQSLRKEVKGLESRNAALQTNCEKQEKKLKEMEHDLNEFRKKGVIL